MVAKTFMGLEEVLAEELRGLGAINVEPGKRIVSFEGDLEMLYKANMCCRTALRILKPIYKFIASDTDTLYDMVKEYDWSTLLSPEKTFAIDTVAYSEEFSHSRFVTYRVKDAIVDWFTDRYGEGKRPGVRLQDADVMINVHIAGDRVTLSLDSSGESLHKRGWREAQTEAPINEVLAAGIIMLSGWRGDKPFVDPMCGSGTFLIEAALIAANIHPGIYRKGFAFENWPDFDRELLDRLYNDDSQERTPAFPIIGADMSPKAIEIARRNIKSAGLARYIDLQLKPLSQWTEAPADGVLVTNPPYGERISSDDMEGLYTLIGNKLKTVFTGYHAWIIGYQTEHFNAIHLSPSTKLPILNGSLECELREYVIFEGDYKSYRQAGNKLHRGDERHATGENKTKRRLSDKEWTGEARRKGFGGKIAKGGEKSGAPRPSRKDEDKSRGYGKPFGRKPFDKKPRTAADNIDQATGSTEAEIQSENPLASRRNPKALSILRGKTPTLPPAEGPIMRPRRGWKKK
ncbi:MAG: THUMP domain-containing protein [Clostridiales bacterium]|nr:THUMP domain-containing protein [Clostridiales bacterium]